MRPYCNSILSSDRMLFDSLFLFIELPENNVPLVTLNLFFETLLSITLKSIVW